MMNYQKIVSLAEQKLGAKYFNIIVDLKDCIASGSTGGEIASIVGYYLIQLQNIEPDAYFILEKDIKQYLLSCEKDGLYFA